MKSNFLTMLALAFLFAFVFSLAMAVAVDLKAVPDYHICGDCCFIPAKGNCTSGRGRMYDKKCNCAEVCPADGVECVYDCPVCG